MIVQFARIVALEVTRLQTATERIVFRMNCPDMLHQMDKVDNSNRWTAKLRTFEYDFH